MRKYDGKAVTCGRCAFTFASGRYLCRDSQVQRPSSVRGQRPLPLPRVLRAHAIDLINNPFLILTHHSTSLFFVIISLTPFLYVFIYHVCLYVLHYYISTTTTIWYSVCYLHYINLNLKDNNCTNSDSRTGCRMDCSRNVWLSVFFPCEIQ